MFCTALKKYITLGIMFNKVIKFKSLCHFYLNLETHVILAKKHKVHLGLSFVPLSSKLFAVTLPLFC